MDYRGLLVKYMAHVRQCEGIDFTDRLNDPIGSEVLFTDEEVSKLLQISAEANKN